MNTAIQEPAGFTVDNTIITNALDKLHQRTIDLKDAQDAEPHTSILADGL